MTLHVTLPDGSPLELDDGATVRDAAAAIGPRLAKAAIAGRVTAAADPDVTLLVDAAAPLHDGDKLDIVTLKGEDADAVDIQRHSASHVMAQAIVRLFPGAKYAIGPTIENGFYYDLQLPEPIAEADLARIEKEMAKIVSQNLPVERYELPVDEALAVFGAGEPGTGASGLPLGLDQPFKVELIEDLVTAAEATGDEVPTISVYRQGEFVDLCRGPHLPSTNKLGNGTFKLTSLAGAYWRGDEKNPMLTRVYGTAFPSKEELAAYLEALELARQRDHRRIGRDLDLFSFHEEGPGFPFFHPKGMRLWNAMIDYWRAEHVRAGYEEISTPVILRRELWERSGHWDNYKENMYFTEIDEQPYAVKPMNCPGGLLDLQEPPALLPRPAAAHGRARPCPPPRDERRPARPLPRALLHPGRRAHLLHPRAARGRGARRRALHEAHLRRLRLHRRQDRAQHPAGEEHRLGRGLGARRGRASRDVARG